MICLLGKLEVNNGELIQFLRAQRARDRFGRMLLKDVVCTGGKADKKMRGWKQWP